ncbi:unnamed protein product [Gordionus sp. m RMFG-2023]|uniref:uncharacterized protein LOC135923891 n=1 Tax=Gordionus sp. m RMFG-2023 TaxID=3053472 RepID=UPI0030E376B5
MFNALSKYVSGYLKRSNSLHSPADLSGSPININDRADINFPSLIPKGDITTKEIDNEWIFVAEKNPSSKCNSLHRSSTPNTWFPATPASHPLPLLKTEPDNTGFLLVADKIHDREVFDKENGCVIVNQNRLTTLPDVKEFGGIEKFGPVSLPISVSEPKKVSIRVSNRIPVVTAFDEAWDRKKGQSDKAKAFNVAQKQAFKQYRKHSDSTSSQSSCHSTSPNRSREDGVKVGANAVNKDKAKNKKLRGGKARPSGNQESFIPSSPRHHPHVSPRTSARSIPTDHLAQAPLNPGLAKASLDSVPGNRRQRNKRSAKTGRNPFNGKLFRLFETEEIFQKDSNTNAGDNISWNTLPFAPSGFENGKSTKGKKRGGGRFFYAQGCFGKRSGIIRQPLPKTYAKC